MAIWPFGRKNKRHTIQVSPDEATTLQSTLEQDAPVIEPTLGRKPSRRSSKRPISRFSRTGDAPESVRPSSQRPLSLDYRTSQLDHDGARRENIPQRPISRTESLARKYGQPNKLQKSKRQADEFLREREIRMLSSTPIDIPGRTTPSGNDYALEHGRRRANGRRADRYMSDISLYIRDSAASSMSDTFDPFTYKVNAFAALTPRPVVRYVESPRGFTARSHEASTSQEPGRRDKDKLHASTFSEESLYYSKRRVNELADSLDAGALRELLDRDRRRREKEQIHDQERLRRKLQERADAQLKKESQQLVDEAVEAHPEIPLESVVEDEVMGKDGDAQDEQSIAAVPKQQPESWLKEESRDDAGRRESIESVNADVIGNIDDSSIREPKLGLKASFAPSHEMGTSRTTLSPSRSSLRHEISSPSQSQVFVASTSDLSERRSETSGRRVNTISSLFRRGSSRLKRRVRERFQDPTPEISHTSQPSHESFCRISTQSSPPPTGITPPTTFVPIGTVKKRSQSKFTEHFNDGPLSPPDSRLQSPDIPESVRESSLEKEQTSTFLRGPTPSASVDIVNPRRPGHQSWTDSVDESDNVPLSQSLASIDSEGSWMSGQIFRRMPQKPGSPVRTNIGSFSAALDGAVDPPDEGHDSANLHEVTNAAGEPEPEVDETWHTIEVARRPVVITPTVRPKSTQGALTNIPSLSPISAEEDYDSAEENPPDLERVASVHGEIGNADED